MKYLKDNFLLTVVMILDLVITALSLILGCLMYTSNCKATLQNRIYVEVTDLISNIDYGLHFGKSLESYYGMDTVLSEAVDSMANIRAMYILTEDNRVIFSDGEGALIHDATELDAGSNIKKGNLFYCSFRLADTARLITESDISLSVINWNGYYRYLGLISAAGFLVSIGIMIILWRNVTDRKRSYKLMIAVLILWIMIISSFVGYSAYSEYNTSIDQMYQTIRNTVNNDVKKIHDEGIDDAMITGIDDYLAVYSDNIREIEEIRFSGDKLEFTPDVFYMRRMMVDYLLQTLLFLAFSAMILAEYQIFMSGVSADDKEGQKNE